MIRFFLLVTAVAFMLAASQPGRAYCNYAMTYDQPSVETWHPALLVSWSPEEPCQPGPRGPQGPAGPQGPQGPAGHNCPVPVSPDCPTPSNVQPAVPGHTGSEPYPTPRPPLN